MSLDFVLTNLSPSQTSTSRHQFSFREKFELNHQAKKPELNYTYNALLMLTFEVNAEG